MKDELCFVDSNIWLYSFVKHQNNSKHETAKELIDNSEIALSFQVINEVCSNLLKKFSFSEEKIEGLISEFFKQCYLTPFNESIYLKACGLRRQYSFSYYDSMIISAALSSGAKNLYTEDMHHGLKIEGKLQIVNPFL